MEKMKTFTTKITLPNIEYKYRHWRLMGVDIFSFYSHKGAGWFRIFGKGLSWKDLRRHKLLFSERNGFTKFYTVGNYVIKKLK